MKNPTPPVLTGEGEGDEAAAARAERLSICLVDAIMRATVKRYNLEVKKKGERDFIDNAQVFVLVLDRGRGLHQLRALCRTDDIVGFDVCSPALVNPW